jgi:hypothetical protein
LRGEPAEKPPEPVRGLGQASFEFTNRNTRQEEEIKYRKKSLGQVWTVNAKYDKLGRSPQGSTIIM